MFDLTGPAPVVYFYYYDGLGSVAALSNINGQLVEQYRYDAFGNTRVFNGSGVQKSWPFELIGNPYMFTGRRIDTETSYATPDSMGLYYYRARVYNPRLARFMQTDPIGAMNLYQYCGNNPVYWIDPWGLCSKEEGGTLSESHRKSSMNPPARFCRKIAIPPAPTL
jgi:RHS repeat-associated protein